MINSVSVPVQTVNANNIVIFTTDRVRSNRCNGCNGGWLYHDTGSGQFQLVNKSCNTSVFEISFNANVTSATTGALAFAIQSNGEAIGGTEMITTIDTADAYQNISASTLVKVPSGASTTISVSNISTLTALVEDANIMIEKVC